MSVLGTTLTWTNSGANTTVFVGPDGSQSYPCWCGQVHGGEFGLLEYRHHQCLHREPLLNLGAAEGFVQLCCPTCGQDFVAEGKDVP